jgi:hypothetical protein
VWLEIEGGVWLNLELIEKIEPRRHEGTAVAWAGGVIMAADSKILFQHFMHHRDNPESALFTKAAKWEEPKKA